MANSKDKDIQVTVDITGIVDALECVKKLEAERDYYRQVVETHLPEFIIEQN